MLPVVVAVVRALVTRWFPVGDNALLAVRAYDVGTVHHPLLGSWTSASLALGVPVNNPGPLYFDVTAPFMWTVGRLVGIGPATALAVGAINIAAALGTVAVGARVGGWRVERWMLVLVAALTWSMGSQLLIDIWQPHALLLPFACLLVLTTGVVSGDLRLAPWWAGVASLIVQTHLAYVYVVGALGVLALVAVIVRARTDATEAQRPVTTLVARALRTPPALMTAGVLVLAWLQPLIEQFTGPGEGNLQRLATNVGGGDLTVGAGPAVKIVAAVTALPPWWTRFGYEDSVPSTPLTQMADGPALFIEGLPGAAIAVVSLASVFAALIVLACLLRRPEQRAARSAALVAVVALTVAVVGLTIQTVTLTGLGNHQVRWIFGLALFVHVAIAWGVTELVRDRRPTVRSLDVALVALVSVLVLANLPFHAHDLGPTADRAATDTLDRTFDDLGKFSPGGPVVYDTSTIRVFEPYSWAILMRFREIGVEFRFDDEIDLRQYGESRRADGDEVGVVRQYERSEALLYDGDGCTLSLRSGVSTSEQAATDEVIEAAADDLSGGSLTVDTAGLPDDVAILVDAALAGDRNAAFRVVAQGLVPVLVEEARIEATPALTAASERNRQIIDRVNSTLRIVAEPATLC